MDQKISFLPHISVTRPVTVTMCLLALLVVGAVSYSRIAVQLLPSGMTPRSLSVRIGYNDSTPPEVEQQLTRPLEEALRTVKGIESVRTTSHSQGVSARITFRQDADVTLGYNQIVDRLDRLKPDLPEDARDNVSIWKFNDDDRPIMWMGVGIDSTIADPFTFLETHLQRPLERIDGVAKVDLWGAYQKSVMIELNPMQVETRGVSSFELVEALQADNFAQSGGYVMEGGKKFLVRSLARYKSLGDIGNIPIPTPSHEAKLKEIANVIYDVPERTQFQRIDGKPAASLGIYSESGANIVDVCNRVALAIKAIEAEQPGLRGNIFFNQGRFIHESISNLQATGVWGGFFAALVLLFYLRAIRMTLIITLSLPLCVMITITVLYFCGWTLNLITMMGLMVGLGMVVDNAIVIVENIYRLRALGVDARTASLQGASEVALAITMATFTSAVVFLPLILMSGNTDLSFFLIRIGVPVIVALMGSLLVALIFIPLTTLRFGGDKVKADPKIVTRVRLVYERVLSWVLVHRVDACVIVSVAFLTIFYPLANMQRGDQTSGGLNDIAIRFYPASNMSLDEVRQILADIETFLETHKKRYNIQTLRSEYRKTFGQVQAFLKDMPDEPWWYVAYKDLRAHYGFPIDHQLDTKMVIQDIKEKLPPFVGVRTTVEGSGGGGGDPSISVYLIGDDTEVLAGMIEEVERRLKQVPAIIGVDSDVERQSDEVRVRLNRERANALGISPNTVARTIAYGLQGANLPRFQTDEREVAVRLYMDAHGKQHLNQLRNFTFRSSLGQEVPLTAFATLEVAPGRGSIRRENAKTQLQVRAFTTKNDLKAVYEAVDAVMDGFSMPRGYSWNKGERFNKFQESDDALMFAGILAVTFVFLLMGVLFESFMLPFAVLFSVPFAFLGVYWTLYLTHTPFDAMAGVGVIVLIGVVVNNAIVLVDLINRLRAEGLKRTEAILEAGRSRFRPILMTTFTTVFGLLPMAAGNSNLVGISYAPLGRTIMGGLIMSTLLTLVVVPLLYTLLDDFRNWLLRIGGVLLEVGNPTRHVGVVSHD